MQHLYIWICHRVNSAISSLIPQFVSHAFCSSTSRRYVPDKKADIHLLFLASNMLNRTRGIHPGNDKESRTISLTMYNKVCVVYGQGYQMHMWFTG